MPNLVITIMGGVMDGVMTDDDPTTPIRIILIDHDNIEAGDPETGAEFDFALDTEQVDEIFGAYDAKIAEAASAPTHLSGPNGCEDGCPACVCERCGAGVNDCATYGCSAFGPPTNVNCLENLRCPECGSEGMFSIACDTIALVGDEGIDEYGDMEWNDKSMMGCDGHGGCGFCATVAEFKIKEVK